MNKKINNNDIKVKLKELFKKKPLPPGIVFTEKPSFLLVVGVYLSGIIVLILLWSINKNIAPKAITQFVNFFKGVEYAWVEGIFGTIFNIVYLMVVVFILYYHIRRETTSYTLTEKEITVKRGLLVRKEIYIPLVKLRNISLNISLFGMILKYGTILVDTGGFIGVIPISNIYRPNEKMRKILDKLAVRTAADLDEL